MIVALLLVLNYLSYYGSKMEDLNQESAHILILVGLCELGRYLRLMIQGRTISQSIYDLTGLLYYNFRKVIPLDY